jgi:hypothetical protein
MQTLVFNTTDKTVKLYEGINEESKLVYTKYDIPTVRIEKGYYEVMQRQGEYIGTITTPITTPIMRLPISNTNMLIEK